MSWIDNPKNFIPASYSTRASDEVDRPRDPQIYKAAYIPLSDSEMPAITHSFHLEYLHLSLDSRSKHETMELPGIDAFCVHCNDIATSTHVLNECIIAQLTIKVLINFFTQKNGLITTRWPEYLQMTPTFHFSGGI